jgi:tetratricopeptide (TPR) repeat protein
MVGSGKTYYYAQVDFYLNSGEIALALHQANKNIAYNEQDPLAYINRARVYERLGKLERAIVDLKEALRLEPDNKEANSYLDRIVKEETRET